MYYSEEKSITPLSVVIKISIILGGLLLGFLISRIFIIPYLVSSNAMTPNFNQEQRILIYRFGKAKPGSVILMDSPVDTDKVLLRRIIGVSGDTIEIKNKIIYRNNNKIQFTWKTTSKDDRNFPMSFTFRDNMPAVKIKRNEFFILNDNIDNSYDSRTFGVVKSDSIIGIHFYSF